MRILSSTIAFALVGVLAATPAVTDKDVVVVAESFYKQDFVKYEGKHDIVKILVPLTSPNFKPETSASELNAILTDLTIFFVEADVQPDGSRVDQGLYVLKGGKATKILEYGRDAAASIDDGKLVFFGAKDGLYVYNKNTNSADKYGPITDSIIGIVKEKGGIIYILNEDGEVYKVTNNGETKEKIDVVVKAQQIVLDNSNNLYFYSDDKTINVLTKSGVNKIEGLPEGYSSIRLIKPPYLLEDKVIALVDNNVYILSSNGISNRHGLTYNPNIRPTAYAPEASYIQYYAHDKKIYGYTLYDLISYFSSLVESKSTANNKESYATKLASIRKA